MLETKKIEQELSTVRQVQEELKALIAREQRNKFNLKDEGFEVRCMWCCFICMFGMCAVFQSQEPLRCEVAAYFCKSLTREISDSDFQVC